MIRIAPTFLALALAATPSSSPPLEPALRAEAHLRTLLSSRQEADAAVAYLRQILARAESADPALGRALAEAIARNLDEKVALPKCEDHPYAPTAAVLQRTVVDYELFKQESFISSGVFPKRYFGYFDRQYDTAAWEQRLARVVHRAVATLNAYQAKRGASVRITDLEVSVTFIAEGGALLLRERQQQLDDIHPVYGIGLDDIATGFSRYPEAREELDRVLGTHLGTLIAELNRQKFLRRTMTFDEGLAGTALMWLYEKELCAAKLAAANRPALETRSPADQFILSSLVYNSGILFDEERIRQIRELRTAGYLSALSAQNAQRRWPLPVDDAAHGRARLREGLGYPGQPTSWSAVYHVLQRYGGYAGLVRFTDVFDERGMYRERP